MISIELQHVGSYEDEQLKVLNPYFVFSWAESWTWNVISSWSTWFQVFYNVCIVRTMANSLIAVVSYCMHCKVCMHLNHGICTSSTDYTCIWYAAFSLNVSLSYTISLILQAHARPRYTVTSIINAQISLVHRLPLSFLLVLPVVERRLATTQRVYTPYSFTSKATM